MKSLCYKCLHKLEVKYDIDCDNVIKKYFECCEYSDKIDISNIIECNKHIDSVEYF